MSRKISSFLSKRYLENQGHLKFLFLGGGGGEVDYSSRGEINQIQFEEKRAIENSNHLVYIVQWLKSRL